MPARSRPYSVPKRAEPMLVNGRPVLYDRFFAVGARRGLLRVQAAARSQDGMSAKKLWGSSEPFSGGARSVKNIPLIIRGWWFFRRGAEKLRACESARRAPRRFSADSVGAGIELVPFPRPFLSTIGKLARSPSRSQGWESAWARRGSQARPWLRVFPAMEHGFPGIEALHASFATKRNYSLLHTQFGDRIDAELLRGPGLCSTPASSQRGSSSSPVFLHFQKAPS
jgi:hypothetical protein